MVLSVANVVFTGIFVVEMLLRWIALGFKQYFRVRSLPRGEGGGKGQGGIY